MPAITRKRASRPIREQRDVAAQAMRSTEIARRGVTKALKSRRDASSGSTEAVTQYAQKQATPK
jgi:hypothetical protein